MTDKWQLIHCEPVEWKQDESGHYCIINAIMKNVPEWQPPQSLAVRLDWLTTTDQPAISFVGTADAVCKNAMRYAEEHGWNVSLEHAAYIGAKLARAEILGSNYVQE